MVPLTKKHFFVYLLAVISAAEVFAQSLSTLNIDWSDSFFSSVLGSVSPGSNVNIVWDTSNVPNQYTLAVLLKQNATETVVATIAAGGVPNNGSFLWVVEDNHVSGSDYYIRLQTGTSSDWGDGTNENPPARGGVYGLAGYFTINSPTSTSTASAIILPSSSSALSTQSSSTQSSSAHSSSALPTHSPSATPQKSGSHRTGSIAGGTVAGVVAAILGAILIALNAKHLKYLLGLLASALFGFFIFGSRRLVFSVDDDVGPTQISLFLTPSPVISDSTPDGHLEILVWKVFNIGHAQRQFDVAVPEMSEASKPPHSDEESPPGAEKFDLTIPSTYGEGVPEIGFGTVLDHGQHVTCENFGPAPAILNEQEEWISDGESKRHKLTATIQSVQTSCIAVGTSDDKSIHPFLLVKRGAFTNDEYRAELTFTSMFSGATNTEMECVGRSL